MSDTIETWGYRQGEARIFELRAGAKLPSGWYDSPAKIPAGGPGQWGEPAVAASQPVPQASPPPLPSIDEQERAEYARLLEENQQLKERVAALEGLTLPPENLPPLPDTAEKPSIGEITARADAAEAAGEAMTPVQPTTPIERARAAKAAKRALEKGSS